MTDDRNESKKVRDDVATLVRLAGRRSPVPQERFDRAKIAAHAAWRQQSRQRSRRRYLTAAVAAAAVVVIAVALRLVPAPRMPIQVEAVNGQAWIRVSGDASPARELQVGDAVTWPADLSTSAGGQVALRLASGHSVRLDQGSQARFVASASVELDRGAIYVDSGPHPGEQPGVSVQTGYGLVREVGTRFEVRLAEQAVHVRLREGAVVVSKGDRTYRVDTGSEFTLRADGASSVRELSASASEWAWAAQISPMLDLEGRTAREFLDWIAREQGWTLAFADESVARSAEATVLSGAGGGLSLDAALETVLPTCRLAHRVVDNVLIVEFDSAVTPSGN